MDAFTREGVVPDVIDRPPTTILKATYNGVEVKQPGATMTPTQVQKQPTLDWNADPESFYTVLVNDPDAPSRKDPKNGEWHHWMVTNIPGGDVSKGDVMTGYVGSAPPNGTGLHRYVVLVFRQQARQQFVGLPVIPDDSRKNRAKQKVRETAARYNLGHPVAGTFYLAEYDSYCEQVYKRFKD